MVYSMGFTSFCRWVLIPFLLCALLRPAAAAAYDDLYRRCQSEMPPVDIVVLVDASGSMTGEKFATVRAIARDFAKSLAPNEHLHLRLFAADVLDPFDSTKQNIDTYLPASPLPGSGTDIASALNKGLLFLQRDEASDVQALFLLTDGRHEPNTAYPTVSWTDVRAKAETLKRRDLQVSGWGIGDYTDIGILKTVFSPDIVELGHGTAAQAKGTMALFREDARFRNFKRQMAEELAKGGLTMAATGAKARGTTFTTSCTLTDRYQFLPVAVSALTIAPEPCPELAIRFAPVTQPITIAPGATQTIPLRFQIVPTASRLRVPAVTRAYDVQLHLTPTAQFPDQKALHALGFADAAARWPASPTLHVQVTAGFPWWAVILSAVTLALTIAGAGKLRRRLPVTTLFGAINRDGIHREDLSTRAGIVPIGTDATGTHAVLMNPAIPYAQLRVEEHGDYAYVVLEPSAGRATADVTVNGTLLSGPVRLVLNPGQAIMTITLKRATITVTESCSRKVVIRKPGMFIFWLLALVVVAVLGWQHTLAVTAKLLFP
jgi:hypothetical protein